MYIYCICIDREGYQQRWLLVTNWPWLSLRSHQILQLKQCHFAVVDLTLLYFVYFHNVTCLTLLEHLTCFLYRPPQIIQYSAAHILTCSET